MRDRILASSILLEWRLANQRIISFLDFNLESIFFNKNIYIMKPLTDFLKTVETSVDPQLQLVFLRPVRILRLVGHNETYWLVVPQKTTGLCTGLWFPLKVSFLTFVPKASSTLSPIYLKIWKLHSIYRKSSIKRPPPAQISPYPFLGEES